MTRGVFAALGWRWRTVNDSNVAHLVPATPGRGSRTACNRLPVPTEDVLGPATTLWNDALPLCDRCQKAER